MGNKILLSFSPICVLITLLAFFSCPIGASPISADEEAHARAWEKYALGLELIVQGKTEEGRRMLEEVVYNYPNTKAAAKAQKYLEEHSTRFDRSGIVSFYLGNMLTTTWAASSLPLLLENDSELMIGTAGLLGVGSGIYTSWLMTRGRDMSLGQDLWIEFIEAASVINFQYAWNALGDVVQNDKIGGKINIGGQTLTSLTSRGMTYWNILGKSPSSGRVFTVINAYAWSQFYYWIAMYEIIGSKNTTLNNSLAVVIPDLIAVSSYYLWEKVDWSLQRAGIISVSGVGGMLTGIFSNMVISELFNFEPGSELTNSLILGCSFAGQVLGVMATSGMEKDSRADPEPNTLVSLIPMVKPEGPGVFINISF